MSLNLSLKKVDLDKCIICGNHKDNKGNKKLSSTKVGRQNVFCTAMY